MDLNKLRMFGELQDKVMELTEGKIPLVTFYQDEHGVSVHNPFMDVTGRFPVDPIKEYGEEKLSLLEAKIKEIETNMGFSIENIEAHELKLYLGGEFFLGKEPSLERFYEVTFEDEPMFMKADEDSVIFDSLNFYVPLYGLWEELVPEAARALVIPLENGKQVNLYANYSLVTKEVSLSWTCGEESGEYVVSEAAKKILLTKMDEYVKAYEKESLEKMVQDTIEEEIWDTLETAVQREWYARPDEQGHYDIEISADYSETNEGLLEGLMTTENLWS